MCTGVLKIVFTGSNNLPSSGTVEFVLNNNKHQMQQLVPKCKIENQS